MSASNEPTPLASTSARRRHSIDSPLPSPAPGRTASNHNSDNSFIARAQQLSAALDQLALNSTPADAAAAKLAALSPCFFHRRIDDAVNIAKVLEEIVHDEFMSHSRLVQTATGVREVSKQLQRRPMKRAVRNVMIVTKARDNGLVKVTRELTEWLLRTPRYGQALGVNVFVDNKLQNSKRFDAQGLIESEPRFKDMLRYWTPDLCWSNPGNFDMVITLGGDGTVLYTSWLFQRIVPPVLSFSLGSLGFLTPFDFEHYREHLNKVMGGLSSANSISTPDTISRTSSPVLSPISDAGMRVNLRMRFTCTVYRACKRKYSSLPAAEELAQFEVLNELVLDRGPSPYVSNLELYGDDKLLTVVQADGIIFSTPTGSTAYSLSAGGSLVHPDIPAILLTPICPHTLSFRPMLLNDTVALRIAIPRHSRAGAYCSFDGKGRIELRQGDYVTISASRYPFPTVVGGQMQWTDSVSRTLRWNTREASQKGWQDLRRGSRKPISSYVPSIASEDSFEEAIEDDEEDDEGNSTEQEVFDIDFDEDDTNTAVGSDSINGGGNASRTSSNGFIGRGGSPAR